MQKGMSDNFQNKGGVGIDEGDGGVMFELHLGVRRADAEGSVPCPSVFKLRCSQSLASWLCCTEHPPFVRSSAEARHNSPQHHCNTSFRTKWNQTNWVL